jgi:hypothetical protein
LKDVDGFGQLAGPDAALPDAPAPPPGSLCPHGCIDVLTGLLARTSHAWKNPEFMLVSACGRVERGLELRLARSVDGADGQAPTTFYQVTGAEDARFELARRCHQHAFQVCGLVFSHARRGP